MNRPPEHIVNTSCWKAIGILGDRSCDQLEPHIHCRNCPTYRQAGRQLLNRPMGEGYRTELTLRLAAKPEEPQGEKRRLLVFRVANVWLALPSACFEQTLAPSPIVKIPMKSNRHFLGLVSAHGELQLCFTLEHWLGPDPDEPAASAGAARIFPRLLVIQLSAQRWVFPADEVLGTIDYPRAGLEPLPSNLAKSGIRLVSALFHLEGLPVKLLDEERLAVLFQEALT
ncbi:MAG: chemotaxis protein CheW [Methylococcaceae bacterium]|nr:chemotaxis protein CheW [Methylococcaceae bacterium]